MDSTTALVNVEQLLHPQFEPVILGENEDFLNYIDIDGVTRRYQKREGVIPTSMDWPIKGWDSWMEMKEQRLRLDNLSGRFPDNWPELREEYAGRDYPLALGGYPVGFFGTLVHLMGYLNLFYAYYDHPDLVNDILAHLTNLWIAIWEEVLAQVEVDCVHIWEDISANKGSMVSPATFREFMSPCYRRVTDFLKGRGVSVILVDTDGNCEQLIPLFLEAGVTGLYPMEVSAGMDVVKARKAYPQLQMMGGIPKSDIALGQARIDSFLEDAAFLLGRGGYIPFGDHLIPPEVSWQDFVSYREKLNRLIDRRGAL
jgi:uroporphyrinogen decarboxylase